MAAQRHGIQGVLFCVLDGQCGISGAQPAETFAQVLDRVWAQTQPLVGLGGTGPACGPDGCEV